MKNQQEVKTMKVNKRGMLLVIVLAVLIVMVSIVNVTYSWFEPLDQNGAGMEFTDEKNIRSENCSFKIYEGTVDSTTKAITYSDEAMASNKQLVIPNPTDVNKPTDGLKYYRITVTNTDEQNGSNISILFNCTIKAGTTIGVVSPTNSTHTYTEAVNNKVFLVRNAYITPRDSAKTDSGTLNIEFFIRYTGDEQDGLHINQDWIKLLYN